MTAINEVYEFLKKAGTYYLATVDKNNQPHVRPFTSYDIIDGKLFIQTSNQKDVFEQMITNPKIEICAMSKGQWIRVMAEAEHIDNVDTRKRMLDDVPELRNVFKYDENDGKCAVLCLNKGTATFYSFTDAPKTVEF